MNRLLSISNATIALALLLAVAALWQMHALQRDVMMLAKNVAALEARRLEATPPGGIRPALPDASSAVTARPSRIIDADLLALQRRVETLETDLSDAIDSLNGTIDEINRMASSSKKASRPGWSAAQASGPPDTHAGGDHPTAWAAATQDAGPEWLHAQFDTPVEISQVRVRETDHPGAIVKVTAILEDGREVAIWRGNEPTGLSAPYEAAFHAPPGIKARAVQIDLDTSKTPGWEEIDAIELVGRDGSRQWASSVDASSSYGARGGLTLKANGGEFLLFGQ